VAVAVIPVTAKNGDFLRCEIEQNKFQKLQEVPKNIPVKSPSCPCSSRFLQVGINGGIEK